MTTPEDVERAKREVYVYRDAPAGYGPRIFALYADVPTLRPLLDSLCTWGGTDKDTGKAKAWEFPNSAPERFQAALWRCRNAGFEVVDASPENSREFWD